MSCHSNHKRYFLRQPQLFWCNYSTLLNEAVYSVYIYMQKSILYLNICRVSLVGFPSSLLLLGHHQISFMTSPISNSRKCFCTFLISPCQKRISFSCKWHNSGLCSISLMSYFHHVRKQNLSFSVSIFFTTNLLNNFRTFECVMLINKF